MSQKHYFSMVAPKAAAFFEPIYHSGAEHLLAVEYLNYGIVGGVQISSLTDERIRIDSILINDEFSPSLFAPYQEGCGLHAQGGLPRELHGYEDSIIVITDAPITTPTIHSRCYGKPVLKVEIRTNRGEFVFGIDESVADPPISEM